MSNGPMTIDGEGLVMADVTAPAAPVFLAKTQVSNVKAEIDLMLPSLDANGDALSGLAKLTVHAAPWVDANPFDGATPDNAHLVAGVQVVEINIAPEQAGSVVTSEFATLSMGRWALAAYCSD